MCGIHHILGNKFEVYCEIIDPFWWRNPDPVVDFTRLVLDRPEYGAQPEPWRGELTEISRILTTASQFEDKALGDRLGNVAAEIGNAIAERASVNIGFEWASHDSAES